jgi:hypothetical protein
MERIKSLSKTNRYFEHPIVDYDNIFKVIMHGKPRSAKRIPPPPAASISTRLMTRHSANLTQSPSPRAHASPVPKHSPLTTPVSLWSFPQDHATSAPHFTQDVRSFIRHSSFWFRHFAHPPIVWTKPPATP